MGWGGDLFVALLVFWSPEGRHMGAAAAAAALLHYIENSCPQVVLNYNFFPFFFFQILKYDKVLDRKKIEMTVSYNSKCHQN